MRVVSEASLGVRLLCDSEVGSSEADKLSRSPVMANEWVG